MPTSTREKTTSNGTPAGGAPPGRRRRAAAPHGADVAPGTDGDLVIEARTAADALAEVTAKLGPGASIVEAGKVLRGGVGGFFAREVVQLRARPGSPAEDTAAEDTAAEHASPTTPRDDPAGAGQPPATTPATPAGDGDTALQRLLSQLSAEVDTEEASFGAVLRRELGLPPSDPPGARSAPLAAPAAIPATPAPLPAPAVAAPAAPLPPAPVLSPPPAAMPQVPALPVGAPQVPPPPVEVAVLPAPPAPTPAPPAPTAPAAATREAAEPAVGAPLWSVEHLQQLGLPTAVVDAVRDLDPRDDAAWVQRIAAAVAPVCRGVPDGPAVLAGPRATRLARALGHAVTTVKETAPRFGTFAVRARDTDANRAAIGAALAGRDLHVVAGGQGWRRFLFDRPAAISVSGPDALPEALQAALDLDLPLGFVVTSGRGRGAAPANAVDIAGAIRDLLPRR